MGNALALLVPMPEPWTAVDVGAGTGVSTIALARACAGSSVVAVEPEKPLREALASRLAQDGSVGPRVTIAASLVDVAITQPVGCLFARNVLHLLSAFDREALLREILKLDIRGPIVLSVDERKYKGAEGGERLIDARVIGESRYERWFAWESVNHGQIDCTNTFRVFVGDRLAREVSFRATRYESALASSLDILAAHGFVHSQNLGVDFVSVRR